MTNTEEKDKWIAGYCKEMNVSVSQKWSRDDAESKYEKLRQHRLILREEFDTSVSFLRRCYLKRKIKLIDLKIEKYVNI